MPLGVRGSNPIWTEVNLWGKLFDDTYYMYVLQNQIPYIPATVYHDPDLNTPWTSPIQFYGNGTLPIDIFFEVGVVYRLEFRKNNGLMPPSQSDPLIYLVENYMASGSGNNPPVTNGTFASQNEVTNPQFSLINFVSPYTFTGTNPPPLLIAPNWTLNLAGTGTVTITQVPLNNATSNPTNAPYALRLTLSGWTANSVTLTQRFYQNGMLWANKTVSTAITAELNGLPQQISASLVDSNGTTLGTILPLKTVNQQFTEFTGHLSLGATSNPNVPPAAYIDYVLALPSNIDIYLTSIQLIVQSFNDISEPSFIQDSINRQIDNTYHYYNLPLQFKPIPSLLTGWDFTLNPAQLGTTRTITSTPQYIWDQTICASVVGNVNVVRTGNNADSFSATTTGNNDAFYMLQYLQGQEAAQTALSNLAANLLATTLTHPGVMARVYLFCGNNSSSIPVLGTTIGTLAASGVFTLTAANWSQIANLNGFDKVYPLAVSNSLTDYGFNGFNGRANLGACTNFAIVVTFMVPTSGTSVLIQSISCVPGDIPTRPAPKSQNETFIDCYRYLQKSFVPGLSPAQNVGIANGESILPQTETTAGTIGAIVRFTTPMRVSPSITTYNPQAANAQLRDINTAADWTLTTVQATSANGFYIVGTPPGGSTVGDATAINWLADARLGIV